MSSYQNHAIYPLEDDDEVGCYYCIKDRNYKTYRKGEAYLCGPGHSPSDGNANYICKDHLDADAVIPE